MKKHLLKLSNFVILSLLSLTAVSCSNNQNISSNQNIPPDYYNMINEETGLFFNTNGEITKYYYHEGANYTDIIIPEYLVDTEKTSKYYGYKQRITSIGSSVFSIQLNAYAQYLNSITLPNSIERIHNYAFYGSSLTKIIMPDSIIFIGDYAFQNCTNLTSITLPKNISKIGNYIFEGSAITSIEIPDSVSHILQKAFYNTKLSGSLYIPDSVIEIAWQAFDGTQITEVSIPKNCDYRSNSFPSECKITIR